MNSNKSKKHSIVTRIFFLLMIVILFEASSSLYTIISTDIATTVENYSYNTFTQTVVNRKSNIESFMSKTWSNISESSNNIASNYNEFLGENSTLTEDEKVAFLDESVSTIIQMITMMGTTGGFIILDDGEDMQYSYSTVYLKSYDSINQTASSDNLQLVRGPAEISKTHGFSLVSNWSYGVSLTDDNFPILSAPMEATSITDNIDYLGYWHISTDISNDNLQILTCSMPIIDKNNKAIGVIGIEISREYFYKFLPENEFGAFGSYGYILADIDENNLQFLSPTLINGTTQNEFLALNSQIPLNTIDFTTHNLEAEPMLINVDELDICIYFEPLDIYVNNSPFADDKIWLVGMTDLNNMTSFTSTFWEAIVIMIFVSLLVGTVISYIVGIKVANPILKLSEAVSKYDTENQIVFEKSNIKEIDELSTVITQMQESILRSANKTDKILELLNIAVGSFEHVKETSTVTVSFSLYKMLDFEEYEGRPIPKEIFFDKLKHLKSIPIKEVTNTYSINNNNKYFKIDEYEQDDLILGVIEDTTEDVKDILVLNYERNYDTLTGIFNRRAFHQNVKDVLKTQDLKIAGFIMFDLDNLKYVNDTFGHDSGDIYIKSAATTINSQLINYGVVGRMSGDEFYAFLYGFDTKEDLMQVLNNLYAQFESDPIEMPNATLFKIRVSGGVSWYGEDSNDLDELQKFADFAMYKGKHTSKGEMRQFDKALYLEESFMLSGKAELNRLLDNELFNYVFQPVIDVTTGEIYSYEALMRPDSEILASPLKLLQIANLEGKLWKVEKIALFKTMSLYKKYRDLFGNAKLFINSIPSENLKEEEYKELNDLYGEFFDNIVIEITEQEQLSDAFIDEKIGKLQSFDLDVALDDYGSGYANDIGLIKIKPNIVKIDRSLISNVHVDPSRQALVQKIIAFCQEQNITVLGEGIETEQELEYLIKAGIKLAQGYYISRPIPVPNFNNEEIYAKLQEIKTNK